MAVAQALMMQKILLCAKIDERTLDDVNKLNRSEARALSLCCAKQERGYLRPVAITRLPMGASVPREPPDFSLSLCVLVCVCVCLAAACEMMTVCLGHLWKVAECLPMKRIKLQQIDSYSDARGMSRCARTLRRHFLNCECEMYGLFFCSQQGRKEGSSRGEDARIAGTHSYDETILVSCQSE